MVGAADEEIHGDFKDLQDALLNTESVEQFLRELAVLAARLVGSGLSCGMTMQSNGQPETVACSDPVAAQVDQVQYQLDNGPCLHAMRAGHLVRIEDTWDKALWPEFERRAASHGIRSCLALPLYASGPRLWTREGRLSIGRMPRIEHYSRHGGAAQQASPRPQRAGRGAGRGVARGSGRALL